MPQAAGERVVDVHRAQERLDGRLRLSQHHVAAAALLVQAAEARVVRLEGRKRGERVGDPPEEALGDRAEQQRIAVGGLGGEERLGRVQELREAVLAQQLAQAHALAAGDRRRAGGRVGRGGFHGVKK